jgi:hypothetical protein
MQFYSNAKLTKANNFVNKNMAVLRKQHDTAIELLHSKTVFGFQSKQKNAGGMIPRRSRIHFAG